MCVCVCRQAASPMSPCVTSHLCLLVLPVMSVLLFLSPIGWSYDGPVPGCHLYRKSTKSCTNTHTNTHTDTTQHNTDTHLVSIHEDESLVVWNALWSLSSLSLALTLSPTLSCSLSRSPYLTLFLSNPLSLTLSVSLLLPPSLTLSVSLPPPSHPSLQPST